jgi:F-type H+-transporting ATPase subunit b
VARLTDILFLAQAEGGGGGGEESGGNFLVSPSIGLMIWTLLAFGITLYLLNKLAYPRIAAALDRRRVAIEESIESAQRAKQEADETLEEYRARLREAREQAEDIVSRARKAADNLADETKVAASRQREELLAQARRDIEHETRRALDELRREVADLTVMATEKITRKSLSEEDHRRLIEEALSEVDFEELAPSEGNGR